jgi:hypothetical protein
MLCVTSSTAKVAIPAARPESRISGSPTKSAKTPPAAAPSRSETTLPTVWSRRIGKSSGSTPVFDSSGIVITPAANAPTATKLICPNERTPELPMKT